MNSDINTPYNGPTRLTLDYTWLGNTRHEGTVFSKTYDTFEDAFDAMTDAVPHATQLVTPDGGELRHLWPAMMAAGHPDIFVRYVAAIDAHHAFQARMSPEY